MAADTALAGLDALDLDGERPGASARERAARIARATWPKLAAIVLVWVVWELIHLSGWKKFVLPGPGVTLSNLWDQLRTGLLWHAIGDTLERAVIGYAVALIIGTVVGLLVARISPLRAAVGSLITGLQTLPSAAWLPFAIILFGLNTSAIIFVIVMAAAPAIANGLIAGVDYTPPLLLKAGKVMGLRGVSLNRFLVLPAALPTFVAGMKQGWAFAWHGLLTAELLVLVAGEPSIGVLFQADQDQTDMPSTIAVMIVILVLGIAVDAGFGVANRAIRKRWGLS
ncbi:MAG TPA: ABC transporter permease subunit [Trebonia sp.]|jgi:NitT/TauT family transport system permease protein